MRIFVTGGHGMVGRNLVDAIRHDHDVLAPRRRELDLLHLDDVRTYLGEHAPDMIIHAAGRVGGIEINRRSNSHFLFDNAVMGLNVVRAADEVGVPRMLNLSSSCTYPMDRAGAITEAELLTGPLEPTNEGYAIGKIAVQRMMALLRSERDDREYKTAVPCNLYGPYDDFDPITSHMVPSAIRKVAEAAERHLGEVQIWGDGTARREFMFVGDLVLFVIDAIARWDSLPDVVNVGLGTDYTITEYYEAVAEVIGYNGTFSHDLDRPVGMRRKLLDCSRVHDWGWRAAHSLKEGLNATYEYYRTISHADVPASD